MSAFSEIFSELAQAIFERLHEDDLRKVETDLFQEWNVRKARHHKTKKEVLFRLQKGYPIPAELIDQDLIAVVETCREQDRYDLIEGLLPRYREAKRHERNKFALVHKYFLINDALSSLPFLLIGVILIYIQLKT